MKDKEKQIEEMAKIMCENDCEECRRESIEFYGNSYDEDTQCVFNVGAERLYEQGYQKIDKDSIVLSKEEIEEEIDCAKVVMIRYDSDGTKCVSYSAYKEYTDRLGDNIKKLMAKIKLLEEELNQASKETAEKIFNKLITRLKDCPEVIEEGYNVQNSVDYFEDIIGYDKFCADETIKKLANEFGVEIKE